jgi:hypothetical protein
MLAGSRPAATAARLGADLRAGIDACDLIEETLAAIAKRISHKDESART